MKIVVVDDERNTREAIVKMIELFGSPAYHIFEADGVTSAVEKINQHQPDLLLLDIQLRDGNGFDVLNRIDIDKDKCAIVFITAFEEFALKAFKYAAIDYLLKPIEADELVAVLQKAEKKVNEVQLSQRLDVFLEHYKQDRIDARITLRTIEAIHIIRIEDILYCEASQSYTTFYLIQGKQILVSKPLGEYESIIDRPNFIRVHQSYLVNMNHIVQFEKEDSGYLITSTNQRIPVSVRKRAAVIQYIDQLI